MSRYRYAGPYDVLEFEGKQVHIGDELDIVNDAFAEEQTRRGYHIFVRVGETNDADEPAVVEEPAEEPPLANMITESDQPVEEATEAVAEEPAS